MVSVLAGCMTISGKTVSKPIIGVAASSGKPAIRSIQDYHAVFVTWVSAA